MKRILILFLLFGCMAGLNACKSGDKQFTVDKIASKVEIIDGGNSIVGYFKVQNDKEMLFEYISPQELSGIIVEYTSNGYIAEFDGVKIELDETPPTSSLVSLFKATEMILSSSVNVKNAGTDIVELTDSNAHKYIYSINCDSMCITEIENEQLKFIFFYD